MKLLEFLSSLCGQKVPSNAEASVAETSVAEASVAEASVAEASVAEASVAEASVAELALFNTLNAEERACRRKIRTLESEHSALLRHHNTTYNLQKQLLESKELNNRLFGVVTRMVAEKEKLEKENRPNPLSVMVITLFIFRILMGGQQQS